MHMVMSEYDKCDLPEIGALISSNIDMSVTASLDQLAVAKIRWVDLVGMDRNVMVIVVATEGNLFAFTMFILLALCGSPLMAMFSLLLKHCVMGCPDAQIDISNLYRPNKYCSLLWLLLDCYLGHWFPSASVRCFQATRDIDDVLLEQWLGRHTFLAWSGRGG